MRTSTLFYSSAGQVNYLVPEGTATGPATIALNTGSATLKVHQEITPVAPGIYAIDGVAEGEVVTGLNGNQTFGYTFQQNSAGGYSPIPIKVGNSSAQVFLILFGTGIQNHATSVLVRIGGTALTPAPTRVRRDSSPERINSTCNCPRAWPARAW